jgi:hypothetical protein
MSLLLTQQEADALLALDKHYHGSERFSFPSLGGALRIPLHSDDNREEFSLDITRGRIELRKNTFQSRARKAVILARIDIGGPPHRNPDGEEIACPHLHLYREGWGDKWAMPLPDVFTNHADAWQTLEEFMAFCNVVTRPPILKELFT